MSEKASLTTASTEHYCHFCGSDRAWHRFAAATGEMWFCTMHKDNGETLFAPRVTRSAAAT